VNKKSDLRAEPRIPHSRRATLTAAGATAPCLIQDFSTNGFLIMCTKPFTVGDVLELKAELYPERFLECKIEVRHITDMCLGTKVVEISDTALKLCRQFIEEHYSERLKFGG
jgi:hypothetical protein